MVIHGGSPCWRSRKVEYTYEMEDNYLDLDRIVAELEAERNRLEQAITLLRERNGTATARKTTGTNGKARPARVLVALHRLGESAFRK